MVLKNPRATFALSVAALSLATLAAMPLSFAQKRQAQPRRGAGLVPSGDIAAKGERLSLMVSGTQRTGLVFPPKNPRREKPPLLIAFHGHGGNGKSLANLTGFPAAWPEALMIFPDGLTGVPDDIDTKGEKPGWQKSVGTFDDRDIALFDAIVEKAIATYNADPEHVYVAGFSNGGRMSYLLWSTRANKIRAIADCASQSLTDQLAKTFSPKPVVVIHGKADQRISAEVGLKDTNAVLKVNQSTEQLTTWPDGTQRKLYSVGADGADTLVLTHQGTHTWPKFATPEVVAFFKTHK